MSVQQLKRFLITNDVLAFDYCDEIEELLYSFNETNTAECTLWIRHISRLFFGGSESEYVEKVNAKLKNLRVVYGENNVEIHDKAGNKVFELVPRQGVSFKEMYALLEPFKEVK